MTTSVMRPAVLLLGATCVLHAAVAQPTPTDGEQRALARTFDEDISELEGQPLIEYRQTTEPVDQEIQLEVPEVLYNFVVAVNEILIPRLPDFLVLNAVRLYILGLLLFGIFYSFYMLVLPIVYEPPERNEDVEDEEDEEEDEEEDGFDDDDEYDDDDTGSRLDEEYDEDAISRQDQKYYETNQEQAGEEDGQYLGYTHYKGELRKRTGQMGSFDSYWTSRSRATAPFMHRLIRSIETFETTMSSIPEPSCTPQMLCETRQLLTYVPSLERIIQTYGLSMNGLRPDYKMALENGATRQSCQAGQPLCTPSFVTWLLEAAKAIERLWPIDHDVSLDFETEDEELVQPPEKSMEDEAEN